MNTRGVIGVARSIWDDPDFKPEPFTEREAFIWLVSAAAWKGVRVRGSNGPVTLNRSEFCFSVRFLAARWLWSKDRVHRFLGALQKRDTIKDTSRDSEKIYSVKNYNKFQIVGLPECDSGATPTATRARHDRDKEEELKELKKEKNITAREVLLSVLDADRADAVLEHRKKLRAPLTAHGAKLLSSEFVKTGDPNAAADAMIAGGWRGFKSQWLKNQATGPPSRPNKLFEAIDRAVAGEPIP